MSAQATPQPTRSFDPDHLTQLVEDLGVVAAERVVGMFLKMSQDYLKNIEMHFKSRDAEGFKRAAHTLKSSARAVGGTLVSDYALRMEQGGFGAYDTAGELAQAVDELCVILRAWRP